ncbi:MAG: isoprenoid biosynthesis glyoxalase ElbB [Opitutaceae bacterium]
MKNVAVVLSGCGVYDGSEIHEAVLTLLALSRSGAQVTCIAPDITQKQVIDHSTGEVMVDEDRNVMQEAARISRGQIEPLDQVRADQYDAFIYIGGYGVAKNLSSFAFDGDEYDADPATVSLIQSAHAAAIPQGFMCISPVLAARALGQFGVQLTIGNDQDVANALTVKGAQHVDCPVGGLVIDADNKVVSTPAYMLAKNLLEAESGINQLVKAILQIA